MISSNPEKINTKIPNNIHKSISKNKTLTDILNKLTDINRTVCSSKTAILYSPLTFKEIYFLIENAEKQFMKEPPLLQLLSPIVLVGDVHGQFSDILRLLSTLGFPPEQNYAFLGDFVDRGPQSIETICLLFALKLRYPSNFFLTRGNHESSYINKQYGFLSECLHRYNKKLWRRFGECFNCMPVSALIRGKIFCTHGGLSPYMSNFKDILRIRRPSIIPDKGLLCDLVWSDPHSKSLGWNSNMRGTSYTFGQDIIEEKVRSLGLDLVVRAHQLVNEGIEFSGGVHLLTVFSAPNYVKDIDNLGAVIKVDENLVCRFIAIMPRITTRNRNNRGNYR